jgi:hypothetical protein
VDGTGERGLSRPLKAVLAALALGALLVVVALASRASHPGSHGGPASREVPDWVADDLMTILVVVYGLGTLGLIVGFFVAKRKTWEAPPTHRRLVRTMVLAALVLAFIGLAGRHNLFPRHLQGLKNPPLQTEISPDDQQRPHARTPAPRSTDRPARFDWLLAAVLGGGLVVGAGLLLARPRTGPAVDRSENVGDELAAAVSESIDDLRREPDARRAVIAAYARMEAVLARYGQPRRPSEAPFEFLARVLLDLRVRADAVRELTELFERAKFSDHEIDQQMKERAIAAFASVKDDLRASAE